MEQYEAWRIVFQEKRLPEALVAEILFLYLVEGRNQQEIEEIYFPTRSTQSFTVSAIQQSAGLHGSNAGKYRGIISKEQMEEYVHYLKNNKMPLSEYVRHTRYSTPQAMEYYGVEKQKTGHPVIAMILGAIGIFCLYVTFYKAGDIRHLLFAVFFIVSAFRAFNGR